MNDNNALGVYVHVPFCRSKCAYCDFYSLSRADGLISPYLDALAAQVDAAPRPRPVDTVYVGGGTPSLLGPRRLSRLLHAVTRRFPPVPGAEITLEANPDSVGPWFDQLRADGFNRVSLGMQSADDALLKILGRVHTMEQTRDAVRTVRRAGFDNLSLDLMYGLPGQSLAAWLDSVRQAVDLGPEHLSCYGLKLEPHTPLYARRDALSFPDDDLQAEMYLSAVDLLSRCGYRQYEISNFARPGRESRHNLKYWTLGEYVGFGPGAHSDFDGVRFAWARDLSAFVGGAWTLSERVEVTERERARERLMLGLRTVDGLDADDFSAFDAFFDECAAAGYVRRTPGRVSLTPEGFLVSNAIIGRVLELFDEIPKKRTCVPAPDSI